MLITKSERRAVDPERGNEAGDNSAVVSVGYGIVPISQLLEDKCDHRHILVWRIRYDEKY